jgi:glucoamylase
LVLSSLAVVDGLLRVETPSGPVWRRYNEDGYGEHTDGRGFDGTGRGRPWPLLTGERGHYELLAGNDVRPYLRAMVAMAGRNGMLPEQVWDASPIPGKRLYAGRPTGSAMPLAWAHAEFVKLLLSSQLGRSFDCPRAAFERYGDRDKVPGRSVWSERAPSKDFFAGSDLRVNLGFAARIRWRSQGHDRWHETATAASLPGVHSAVLPTHGVPEGTRVELVWAPGDTGGESARHEVLARGG